MTTLKTLKDTTLEKLQKAGDSLKKGFTPAMRTAAAVSAIAVMQACENPLRPQNPLIGQDLNASYTQKESGKYINRQEFNQAIAIFNQNMPANIYPQYPDTNGLIVVEFPYTYKDKDKNDITVKAQFLVDFAQKSFSVQDYYRPDTLHTFQLLGASPIELMLVAGRTVQVLNKYTHHAKLTDDAYKLFNLSLFKDIEFDDGGMFDIKVWPMNSDYYPTLVKEQNMKKYLAFLNGMGRWKETARQE